MRIDFCKCPRCARENKPREPFRESTDDEILLDIAACLCLTDAQGRA